MSVILPCWFFVHIDFALKETQSMFLNLAHTRLDVFQLSKKFVLECYKQSKALPADERFAMTQQLRRAALSVHLNIAEGCSRKSGNERKRYFEIARGSVIEVDTAMDIAVELEYLSLNGLEDFGTLINRTFACISGVISSNSQ